ncbi:phage head maturation protease [Catenuloplanes nepalensis]|uniref:Phage head maturation protease n=1 Tax=Catenuloplanes nepalensis TaxID=587533 RepID=A0ABT9MUT5_9ACTN|nr:HK97 family phage prohead protease [Catenuloplanes nepalensis]MDP9795217.1 phage head maturation protease [Catenuloplanes nepalensis]
MQLSAPDTDKRTIKAFAYTTDVEFEAENGAGEVKRYRFSANSVRPWREHIPVYAYHDDRDVIGRVSSANWETGEVELKISDITRGREMLTLAADGALGGTSMFLQIEDDEEIDGVVVIKSATCREISLVSHPAVPTAVLTGVALSAPEPKEPAMTDNCNADTVELSAPQGPSIQPIPLVGTAKDEAPYPHLFGGRNNGHSFFKDLRLSTSGDSAAAERVLKLAVTTADLPPTDAYDSGIRVTPPDPRNPLSGILTTRSLNGDSPFYVLHRDNTGDTNLSNPHVEGVEPVLGDIGTWSRATVEPGAVSGKVAVTREAFLADTTPEAEALVFARMDVARRRAIEVNAADALADLTLPAGQVHTLGGANVADELTALQLDLLYSVDGDRFTTAIVGRDLFGDLVNAKDSAGRPLYPILGATNANGTTAPGLRYVNVGGMNVYPMAGLVDGGYLLDPSVVISWLGPVLNFTFDYEVAWVRLSHFQFQAFDVVDTSGIRRLTRAA